MYMTRYLVYDMQLLFLPGVKERFGAEVLERLEREGAVPIEWRAGRGRQPLRWTLTKKAC